MKFLFFDTETTGLPKYYNAPASAIENWPRLVQLAYIVTNDEGLILHEHESIIKPIGFQIPKQSSDVHGVTNEIANEKGVNVINELSSFNIHAKECEFLIAHNIAYDEKIMGAEFIRAFDVDLISNSKKFCTMHHSTKFCEIPGNREGEFKWPKLVELHQKLFNEGFDGAHNALNDVRALVRCFFEMKRLNIKVKK